MSVLALHLAVSEMLLTVLSHHRLSVHVNHVRVLHHLLLHRGFLKHLLLLLSFFVIHFRLRLLTVHINLVIRARSGRGRLMGRGVHLLLSLGRRGFIGGLLLSGCDLQRVLLLLLIGLIAHIQTIVVTLGRLYKSNQIISI